MRMHISALTAAACLLAAGCTGGEKKGNEAAPSNAVELSVDNGAAGNNVATATDPLAPYVGKYPFDKVGGKTFYEQDVVKTAVAKAVPEKEIATMVGEPGEGPATPIALKDGKVVAWACEAHNCGDHNWAVLADGTAGTAQVCYHDAETMQDQSRWYDGTGASAMKPGECPSE